jgi:hypothetical protein
LPNTGKREEMIRSLEKRVIGKKVSHNPLTSGTNQQAIPTTITVTNTKINTHEQNQVQLSPLPLASSSQELSQNVPNVPKSKESFNTSSPRTNIEDTSQVDFIFLVLGPISFVFASTELIKSIFGKCQRRHLNN